MNDSKSFCSTAETPAKNEKSTTSTPSQNNNQQRRGQKRKLKEDEPFVVHENGKIVVIWMKFRNQDFKSSQNMCNAKFLCFP